MCSHVNSREMKRVAERGGQLYVDVAMVIWQDKAFLWIDGWRRAVTQCVNLPTGEAEGGEVGVVTNACGFITHFILCSSSLEWNCLWLFQLFHVPEGKKRKLQNSPSWIKKKRTSDRKSQSEQLCSWYSWDQTKYNFPALKRGQRPIKPGRNLCLHECKNLNRAVISSELL